MTLRGWTAARGFSGFLEDPYSTCDRSLLDTSEYSEEDWDYLKSKRPWLFHNDSPKEYVPAIEYLESSHEHYKTPLFTNQAKNFMWMTSRNVGKMLTPDELVYTDKGPITLEDAKVGDQIFDETGSLTRIVAKKEWLDQEVYEITLSDGRKVKAGQHHEWLLYRSKRSKPFILETQDMFELYKGNFIKPGPGVATRRDNKLFIKQSAPIQHSFKSITIDPYYLGLWLGDGHSHTPAITSKDEEVIQFVRDYTEYLGLKYRIDSFKDRDCSSIFTCGERGKNNNTLLTALKAYKLLTTVPKPSTYDKFIPTEYLYNTEEIRLEVLKGLMDTDGSVDRWGKIEFSTSFKQLSKDFAYLLGSLGIRFTVKPRIPFYYTKDRIKVLGKTSYRFFISTERDIFKLERKLKLYKEKTNHGKSVTNYTSICNMAKLGVMPGYCIEVDNASHLFLTSGFLPTHNSYMTANGVILHEQLFSGQDTGTEGFVKYDPDAKSTSTQVVGAASSHYSESLMSKVKDAYDMLPGALTLNTVTYPSPLSAKMSGSWKLGSKVVQKSKKKIGKKWEEVGSLSTIEHKSFKDNSFAAQGLRCTQMIFEEIGVFTNLEDSYLHSIDNMQNGGTKYGSAMFIGTGGDMFSGTVDAHKMFYAPDKYDIYSYKDSWESQKDIAYFIPDTLTKNEFKDDWGWTDIPRSLKHSETKRESLRTTSDSTALYQHIQYHPLVPSEVFLSRNATIFPSQELRERERKITENDLYKLLAKKVELYYDPSSPYNGINYKIDIDNRLNDISNYPIKETDSKEGCVVIYEFPNQLQGIVPHGSYIIGHDPYRTDGEQGSLASIYVMKTSKYAIDLGHNEIVASYVGRPFAGKGAVNEILMKLSLFYGNAKIFFENNVGSTKEYFEKHRRLDLLASQPRTILSKKAAYEASDNNVTYGYPMSNQHVKKEVIGYLRDWLLEEHHIDNAVTYRNIDLIADIGLIKELLSFNFDGNYDRVMGVCGCIIGLRETENQFKNSIFRKEDYAIDLTFITNNKQLFGATYDSSSTSFF
jgi:hypothetical protein